MRNCLAILLWIQQDKILGAIVSICALYFCNKANDYSSTNLVESCEFGSENCQFGFKESVCDNWPTSGSDWLRVVPWGMRSVLKYIDETYNSKKDFV